MLFICFVLCSGSVIASVFCCTQPFFCTIICTLRVQRTLHCASSGVPPTLVFLNTTHDVKDAQKYKLFTLQCHSSTCTCCGVDACRHKLVMLPDHALRNMIQQLHLG